MPSSTLHKISKATLEVHQNQIYAGWGHLTKKKGMLTGKSYGTTTSTVAFFAFARVVVGFSWVHRANSDSERTRIPAPIAALDTGPISKKKVLWLENELSTATRENKPHLLYKLWFVVRSHPLLCGVASFDELQNLPCETSSVTCLPSNLINQLCKLVHPCR